MCCRERLAKSFEGDLPAEFNQWFTWLRTFSRFSSGATRNSGMETLVRRPARSSSGAALSGSRWSFRSRMPPTIALPSARARRLARFVQLGDRIELLR